MDTKEIEQLNKLQELLDQRLTIREISVIMCIKQYHVSVLKRKLEKYNQIKRFL